MNNKINVVDAFCGAGKSSWAISHVQNNDGPWVVITPYLTEIDRIIKACPDFVQPEAKVMGYETKADDLKKLLAERRNICATHELLKRFDKVTVELIKDAGYSLVLDEILEVVQPVQIRDSVQTLLGDGVISIKEVRTRTSG